MFKRFLCVVGIALCLLLVVLTAVVILPKTVGTRTHAKELGTSPVIRPRAGTPNPAPLLLVGDMIEFFMPWNSDRARTTSLGDSKW